jgi:hypothetical protein
MRIHRETEYWRQVRVEGAIDSMISGQAYKNQLPGAGALWRALRPSLANHPPIRDEAGRGKRRRLLLFDLQTLLRPGPPFNR